jgi:membrane protein
MHGHHQLRTVPRSILEIIRKNELGLLASSMAFATVLAVMPLVAVSMSIFLFVEPLEPYLKELERLLLRYLLSGPGNTLLTEVQATIAQMRSSVVGGTGLVFLLAASTKLISDIDTAVQRVWGVKKDRPRVHSLLYYLGVIVLGPVALAVVIAVLSVDVVPGLTRIPSRVVAYIVLVMSLYAVYQLVPRARVRVSAALIASAGSVVLLAGVQYGYGWITSNVLNYNRIYGSLAVFPLFLIWLLLFWIVFLLGNAACAAMTHRLDAPRRGGKTGIGRGVGS